MNIPTEQLGPVADLSTSAVLGAMEKTVKKLSKEVEQIHAALKEILKRLPHPK